MLVQQTKPLRPLTIRVLFPFMTTTPALHPARPLPGRYARAHRPAGKARPESRKPRHPRPRPAGPPRPHRPRPGPPAIPRHHRMRRQALTAPPARAPPCSTASTPTSSAPSPPAKPTENPRRRSAAASSAASKTPSRTRPEPPPTPKTSCATSTNVSTTPCSDEDILTRNVTDVALEMARDWGIGPSLTPVKRRTAADLAHLHARAAAPTRSPAPALPPATRRSPRPYSPLRLTRAPDTPQGKARPCPPPQTPRRNPRFKTAGQQA